MTGHDFSLVMTSAFFIHELNEHQGKDLPK